MKLVYLCFVLCIICVGIMICVESARGIYTYYQIKRSRKHQNEVESYYDVVRSNNARLLDLQEQVQQMRESIHRIEERTNAEKSMEDCNSMKKDSLISSLLDDYEDRAKDNDIRFLQDMEAVSSLPCNELDTVSLLGNLLDNAMEACLHRKGVGCVQEDCFIQITLKAFQLKDRNGMLLLVENSKNPQCKPLENGFVTTKKDAKEHGKGVAIIKGIVKHYGGKIFFEDKGDTFVTRIEFLKEPEDV